MPSSFNDITRRLDINPASRDTTNDKTLKAARGITKVGIAFEIPLLTGTNLRRKILQQINYTMTAPFKIRKIIPLYDVTTFGVASLTIRFRQGQTVHRYRLDFSQSSVVRDFIVNNTAVQASLYNGEVIQPNFCIEVWGVADIGLYSFGPFDVVTSRLRVPNTECESNYSLDIDGAVLTRADLVQPMPETLPVDYGASSVWLDNP